MQRHFEHELRQLNQLLHTQTERIAESVRQAVRALLTRDPLATATVERWESDSDATDIRIEEECLKILALHQPVADQLRYVFSVARVNYSLERIGDLAARIARKAATLGDFHVADFDQPIQALTDAALNALLQALNAFTASNVAAARAVVAGDEAVDRLRDDLLRRIDEELRKGGDAVPHLLRLRQTAQYLERIADHARHIGECVVYHIEGDVVRHRLPEAVSRKPMVLFLCTGNSARSQMAEALLRHMAGDRYEARSAGTNPRPIHPLTFTVMQEIGISLEGHYPKKVDVFREEPIHTLIVVCSHAVRNCPITWPGIASQIYWDIPDPAAVQGNEEEKHAAFQNARELLTAHIRQWLAEQEARAAIAAQDLAAR